MKEFYKKFKFILLFVITIYSIKLLIDWYANNADREIVAEKPQTDTLGNPADNREIYKLLKPKCKYREIVQEPIFHNLNMIGDVSKNGVTGDRLYGMILRTLRFKNISRKVEKKYQISENLILAMIMYESGGVDLLPNSSDDGGVGLCHMQPIVAQSFGLKTYRNCNKMVSKIHGIEIRKLIQKKNYDRKKLLQYDDRFHPLLNIDAVGRILSYYRAGMDVKGSPEKTAIWGYSGSKNYEKYYKAIVEFRNYLNDNDLIEKVRQEFNRRNPNLLINGVKANFDDYIYTHLQQNLNYGLSDYK